MAFEKRAPGPNIRKSLFKTRKGNSYLQSPMRFYFHYIGKPITCTKREKEGNYVINIGTCEELEKKYASWVPYVVSYEFYEYRIIQ